MPDARHWHGLSVAGAPHAVGGRQRADARRDERPRARRRALGAATRTSLRRGRPRRRRASCGWPSPRCPSCPASCTSEVRRALDETVELLRSLGHDGLRAQSRLQRAGHRVHARVSSRACSRRARPCRGPSASLGAPAGSSAWDGRSTPPRCARRMRDEARQTRRILQLFDDHDVLLTPLTARPPVKAGAWEGLGALRTLVAMSAVYPYTAPWNTTGQPAASVPGGIHARGACRSRSSWWAARTTRPRCTRSPARSRPSARGRTAVRPSRSLSAVREVRLQDTLSGSCARWSRASRARSASTPAAPPSTRAYTWATPGPFVVFALLKRFLEREGLEVTLVENVTDVNDKIYDGRARGGRAQRGAGAGDDRPLRGRHRPPGPRPPRPRAAGRRRRWTRSWT